MGRRLACASTSTAQLHNCTTSASSRRRVQSEATVMHRVNLFYRSFGFIHSCFLAFAEVVSAGSRSTPFFDAKGSVHMLRLKQHGLRIPDLSFENATSIRLLRVSCCAVALIQRIQSQRAIVVQSIHRLCACGSAARALFKSSGTWGSVHSLAGS